MAQDKQTSELAQLFENLSHEAMIDCAKIEFRNRIEPCKYEYYSDDDSDDNVQYLCCAKHNSVCRDALDKYDMIKLLQTAETWYKELHRVELPDETFVELFVKSLPDDVYVLLEHVDMEMYGSCINCDENSVKSDDKEYNFYTSVGLMSLAECFCSKCGEQLLYVSNEFACKNMGYADCPCESDSATLIALKQNYCKQCRREFVYVAPDEETTIA
uniref:Maco-A 30 n=1 Tax=Mamestra configurata nucleopolyhedrovirus TaxID=207830 RepID=A0A5B9G745_NPVMC|nr:Maco-A 30 [Mamestra configurata nucleopolyhedrovirus A]